MGLPWIKLAVDLPDHPKVAIFETSLDLWQGMGLGAIVSLWCWVARMYPDGWVPKAAWVPMARNALRNAQVMTGAGDDWNNAEMWQPPEAVAIVTALGKAGLAEVSEDGFQLHDWEDFNSAHAKKAEQNRERQRRFRKNHPKESTSARVTHTSNEDRNDGVTPESNAGNTPRGEERRVEEIREEKRESFVVDPPARPQAQIEPWDPAVLRSVQAALRLTDLDNGWGQFVGQSLAFPAEARHAAAREFIHRGCAGQGKDWPYLLGMIRNGAGRVPGVVPIAEMTPRQREKAEAKAKERADTSRQVAEMRAKAGLAVKTEAR